MELDVWSLDGWRAYLEQLWSHVRPADVLDVGVVALLLYLALSWLRQRASRPLLVGLASIAAIYLAAQWWDMYLTTMMFRAGVLAVLLGLIVIFQDDLRRAFERLASSQWFQTHMPADPAQGMIDTLVESICTLAEQRTGALIVFEGREPLERHVRGGVPVDGKISLPLLYSIFHPDSPGHDGAIVVRGERIEALGVHLPLSRNLAKVGEGGTRHTAALGLSEQCDAMVVVVSEERGTISIAHQAELREVEPGELKTALERNYLDSYPQKPPRGGVWRLTGNLGLKLISILLAAGLWLLLAYRVETVQRTFVVPIEYRNLPDNWVVNEPEYRAAEVTVSGSERAFDRLDPGALIMSLDLSHVRTESVFVLETRDYLKLPAGLTVSGVDPERVRVAVRRKLPENPGQPRPDQPTGETGGVSGDAR